MAKKKNTWEIISKFTSTKFMICNLNFVFVFKNHFFFFVSVVSICDFANFENKKKHDDETRKKGKNNFCFLLLYFYFFFGLPFRLESDGTV